jgi:glycosyltransferase involved in cell wall biosynthesis
MKFSIITPSFRSSRWLRLCIPSVADQGVEVEHIVQDSCSDDGTQEWLPRDARVRAIIEKDGGMYDAVNRGLRRATGEVVAYLNCDEQYLPGALQAVARFFEQHPKVEVAFGDAVVVGPDGGYLCHRLSLLPTKTHTLVSGTLAILSCATFFRRSALEHKQLYFDTRFKDLGDAQWVLTALERGAVMGLVREFTSAFTNTGENMNFKPNAIRERKEMFESAPAWARALRQGFVAQYRLRKLLAGHYSHPPFDYGIYTLNSPDKRVVFHVENPTGVWKGDPKTAAQSVSRQEHD